MEMEDIVYATGRRKSSIAKTWLITGTGKIIINGLAIDDYFRFGSAKTLAIQALTLTNTVDSYDIKIRVLGGGVSGQAGAIRHSITRALLQVNPELRQQLKKAGFVRRDPRVKERKKYGQKGARARYQFSTR